MADPCPGQSEPRRSSQRRPHRLELELELEFERGSPWRRVLSIPSALADVLSLHLAERGLTAADAGALLFTAPDGRPLNYANWRRRVWLPAAAAGLEDCDFHDLRRAASTALVQAGVDVKTRPDAPRAQ